MLRKTRPADLSNRQRLLIQPLLPPPAYPGHKRITALREGVNTILYVLRSGGAWHLLPL